MNDMQFRAVRTRSDKSESEKATVSESAARLRNRLNVRTQSGDVVQSVRTLPSHRHNDVSDLKTSNLVQPTSVRPVTVSAISLHSRKRVVRSLEVPDVFLLRDRTASRMAHSFRQDPNFSMRRANGNGRTRNLFHDWHGRFHTLGRRLLSTSSAR
jgi:hypothetical protein